MVSTRTFGQFVNGSRPKSIACRIDLTGIGTTLPQLRLDLFFGVLRSKLGPLDCDAERDEPRRDCRRLFGLSHATIASSLICAS